MARVSAFFAASAIFLPRFPSSPNSLSLSNGNGEIKKRPVRLRGKARRASGALRGDGTVHGAIRHRRHSNRGAYGGRAEPPLNRVQERERISKRRVEDLILNRAQRSKPFRVS
ncbi:unnamed protein product, partial [Brassica oleracea var. botrytis]